MEENKVATHRDLRERAELVASANNAGTHGVYNCYSYPNLVNAIFRELVAVRDQSAKAERERMANDWMELQERCGD